MPAPGGEVFGRRWSGTFVESSKPYTSSQAEHTLSGMSSPPLTGRESRQSHCGHLRPSTSASIRSLTSITWSRAPAGYAAAYAIACLHNSWTTALKSIRLPHKKKSLVDTVMPVGRKKSTIPCCEDSSIIWRLNSPKFLRFFFIRFFGRWLNLHTFHVD